MGKKAWDQELQNELKTGHIVWGFSPSALHRPSHLHEQRHGYVIVCQRKAAADESVRLQFTRTEDAGAAIAEVLNAAVKFFWQIGACRYREQTSGVDIQYLRIAFVLTSLSIW